MSTPLFALGDVVQLKSGGPMMVLEMFSNPHDPQSGLPVGDNEWDMAQCRFWNEDAHEFETLDAPLWVLDKITQE